MKKLIIVIGTRPEAIKMAPVILELKKCFKIYVCVTAQQREMLDQVLKYFRIKPEFDLDIMQTEQDLFSITCKILPGIKQVFSNVQPDGVLVHGDTTTSMVSALAAFYLKIPVMHIEAGLRTYNHLSPYPEEINRQITARIATLHFAPTAKARQNLLNEQVCKDAVFVTGNTVIDSLLSLMPKIKEKQFIQGMQQEFVFLNNLKGKLILVTGHRRENFGKGLENICFALRNIAVQRPEDIIVYPVHLNPNVKLPVEYLLSDIQNIYLIPPQEYLSFVYWMDRADIILTDSGGIQEEAPSFGKPVLVMRDKTERPEAIAAGTAKLVGVCRDKIVKTVITLLENPKAYQAMLKSHNPYGDGTSSKKICEVLKTYFAREEIPKQIGW